MRNVKSYVRKFQMINKGNKKFVPRQFKRKVYNYFAVCRYCGYSGSDWSASGECPSCGEVN